MKRCIKCGAALNDKAAFCSKCGSSQQAISQDMSGSENQTTEQPPDYSQQLNYSRPPDYSQQLNYNQKPKRTSKVVMGIIVAIAIAYAITVCGGFIMLLTSDVKNTSGNPSVYGAVTDYYEALSNGDAEALVEATCTNKMKKALVKSMSCSESELAYLLEEEMGYKDVLYIDNIKIIDRERKEQSEIDHFVNVMRDETGITVKISELYEVDMEFSYYDADCEEWKEGADLIEVYRLNDKWYVLPN